MREAVVCVACRKPWDEEEGCRDRFDRPVCDLACAIEADRDARRAESDKRIDEARLRMPLRGW